ncbi:MAG: glycine zipper domain-containing protein [Phycisphaerales bacterium]
MLRQVGLGSSVNRSSRLFSAGVLSGLAAVGVGGCNNAGEGALSGAALGAGAGAIIGSLTGSAGTGAAIGAVGGALGGAVIGDQNARNDARAAAYSGQPRPATGGYCDR